MLVDLGDRWFPVQLEFEESDNEELWERTPPGNIKGDDLIYRFPVMSEYPVRIRSTKLGGEIGKKIVEAVGDKEIIIMKQESFISDLAPIIVVISGKGKFVDKTEGSGRDINMAIFHRSEQYSDDIAQLQRNLLASGDYHSLVDGKLDNKTLNACDEFAIRTKSQHFTAGSSSVNTAFMMQTRDHAQFDWVPISQNSGPDRIYEMTVNLVRWGLMSAPARTLTAEAQQAIQAFKSITGANDARNAGSIQGGIGFSGVWMKLHEVPTAAEAAKIKQITGGEPGTVQPTDEERGADGKKGFKITPRGWALLGTLLFGAIKYGSGKE